MHERMFDLLLRRRDHCMGESLTELHCRQATDAATTKKCVVPTGAFILPPLTSFLAFGTGVSHTTEGSYLVRND
jgi:hypothetical protein